MQVEEANKLIAWMVAVFPQWKPDKMTTVVWAEELPEITATQAMEFIRTEKAEHPSAFPPDVLTIANQFRAPTLNPVHEAKIAFAYYWERASKRPSPFYVRLPGDDDGITAFRQTMEELLPVKNSERAKQAFQLAATGTDHYREAKTTDKDWHEKRFVDIYCGLTTMDRAASHLALASGASAIAQLEAGDDE